MTSPEPTRHIVGVDIGGANIKYASPDGFAHSRIFQMWQDSDQLRDVLVRDLVELQASSRQIDALAITMTGELADCFLDRNSGVRHIVEHACEAATRISVAEPQFYSVDGEFVTADQACSDVDAVAAANWHALASYVGQEVARDATLVDIGTTTTDLIPIRDGRVATNSRTDHDRLVEGSLVYVGCRRTPVCALVDRLEHDGRSARVMNERFATIDDARLVLNSTVEDVNDCDTADGKPRIRSAAANRLARMVGLDQRSVDVDAARALAVQVIDSARRKLSDGLVCVRRPDEESPLVISGHGDELLDLRNQCPVINLSDHLGSEMTRCAPSYAVAKLYGLDQARVTP